MFWGGIFTNPPESTVPEYVLDVYRALVAAGVAGPTGPWPWQGLNLHVHRSRTPGDVNTLFDSVAAEMQERQDRSEIIVGEWGVTVEDECPPLGGASGTLLGLYDAIVDAAPPPSKMFLFSHPRVVKDGRWALVYWEGMTAVPPDTEVPNRFRITARSTLYDPYDTAVGPPDRLNEPELLPNDCLPSGPALLRAWGANGAGRLGDGTTADRLSATPVGRGAGGWRAQPGAEG